MPTLEVTFASLETSVGNHKLLVDSFCFGVVLLHELLGANNDRQDDVRSEFYP
jgi:hypothetical protein